MRPIESPPTAAYLGTSRRLLVVRMSDRTPALARAVVFVVAIAAPFISARAADEPPKPTAPDTPPDLILSCHYDGPPPPYDETVEVWNSGFARMGGTALKAEVTFARIAILFRRWPEQRTEWTTISRVNGALWREFRDANGEPEVTPRLPVLAHCEAAPRRS
jgi:hypothetical protein